MRSTTLALTALLTAAHLLSAQAPPLRPALVPGDDTCDANNYYRLGITDLRAKPREAAAAFYWAQRLAPGTALAYYAQRVALLAEDPVLLRRYVEQDRRTLRSARVQRIDSLYLRAMIIDPFFPPVLDEHLIVVYATTAVANAIRSQTTETPHVTDDEVEQYVRREIENGDEEIRAWLSYGRGRYRAAADYWGGVLRRHPDDDELRMRRARALYLAGQPDSARTEVEAVLAAARRAEARAMRYVYESKAMWEYQLGRIHEARGDGVAARDAYQRALLEDLSFLPAHVRLAYVAIRAGDTASAVTELERAVALRDDDLSAQWLLGMVLAARNAFEPATQHLRRAIEIEPWYAQPHFVLADVRQRAGDAAGAAVEYRRFLALAARDDLSAFIARHRLTALPAPSP